MRLASCHACDVHMGEPASQFIVTSMSPYAQQPGRDEFAFAGPIMPCRLFRMEGNVHATANACAQFRARVFNVVWRRVHALSDDVR